MICLYAADESLFEHNGLGILDNDLKKCHVEEELNNLYTLTAQYPLWAKFGKSIRNGMIIKAPTPNGDQLFRIYQSKPSMGMLEIHAFHIFYDLAFNFVEDTNIVSKSGQAWLQQLSQNTQYRHPFTFFSDISTVAGSRVVRKNCVEILLNTSLDNSFVNRFGGEILRDNFNVYFNRAIGENRGFKIRHKKNLKGYTANIDDKSVITRIMPIGFDGLLLPEKYVDSPRISDYPFPRIGKVEVDVKAAVGENADAKDAVPLNEAYTKMRTLIKEQFGVIDVPTCSYEVDFVELSKTKEYADFQKLETVRIGDTVTVSHDEDGFYVEAKVIRYEYDSLAGSLLRIEAGQFESRSSNNSINQQRSIEQQLEDVKTETSNMVQVAANGKNTIYRGIDRPENANIGDLWYEPLENSIVLKQWSGVDWELIPISDQNLGNVNVNNLSGNHIDVRRFRISSGDRDILYVNEVGEVILNAKRVQIDFTDVATKDDLKKIELTPGPKGEKGDPGNDGVAGRDGNKVYTSIYEMSANQSGIYLSDLTPTANPANLPPIGSIVIAPSGKMYPIIALNPTSTPPSYTAGALVGNIKGPQGDNGQTPVVHWAYSDNADGAGLTTSDNGQRYIGHYSDYTQADSTDKTKYRWADRWAKIEVGGINLLTDTDEETVYISKDPAAMEFLRTPYDLAKVFDRYGLATYTLSFDLKADKAGAVHVYMQNGSGSRYGGLHADIGVTTEWKRYHVTFTPTEGNMELSESFLAFYGVYGTGVVPYARKFQLEKGTVPTDYGPKPNSMRVGGRNFLRNSSFVDGVSYWQNNSGAEQFSWRSVPEFATQLGRKGCIHLYSNGLPLDSLGIFQVIQDMQLSEQEKITLSFDVVGREGNDSGLMVIINNHLFDVRQIIPASSIRTYSKFTKTSLERKALTFTIPKACDAISVIIIFHGGITGDVVLTDLMLERGLVATSHQESPSDIADRIGVKADQALTQEQLNALNERAGIIQAELEAKASLDTVNNILKQIKDMKAADEATWAKVEKDLITHLQRVIKIETNLGDQAQRWNAVDTFMQVSNDGLSLGKADGSSSMLFSPDGRITMFSSGTPVMYVDKGVIHIDNGIFSKTVQIGRFREEQYHNNPDINVKRYVG
ncbi:TPA: phage tail protein [Streptococcus suis]|nr:phage tail protein [Streptococcus suis]HEL2013450.1 phage tail protein [Streptococcus suis]HEL2020151.1 phage tail protein [Streptococcus suis]HEL2381390.1 phage tail protein [Streptococcus suis]